MVRLRARYEIASGLWYRMVRIRIYVKPFLFVRLKNRKNPKSRHVLIDNDNPSKSLLAKQE